MIKNFPKLLFSIGICLGAGIIGSLFMSSISTWYVQLVKPTFFPPNWVFGPVWILLYILMGISLYIVWQKKKNVPFIFWIQLILNAAWSIIFFGLKNPMLALIDIIILWFAIALTIKTFNKINKTAAGLLMLYLYWVSFAVLLNIAIVMLNH